MSRLLVCILSITLFGVPSKLSAQQYMWANQLGSASADQGRLIGVDAQDNVYTIGSFDGTIDFDPGTGDVSLTPSDASDYYLTKYDKDGNLLWVEKLNMGPTTGNILALKINDVGEILIGGAIRASWDADPGVGVHTLEAGGYQDAFLVKLDTDGNFIWVKNLYGSSNSSTVNTIQQDKDNNIILAGTFSGYGVDFDPGPGVTSLSMTGYDNYISKLDEDGNFLWASVSAGTAISLDESGNIVYGGRLNQFAPFDADPGPAEYNLDGSKDILMMAKLDASGQLLWANSFGGQENGFVYQTATDPSGNIYVTGQLAGTMDFDPGAGVTNLSTSYPGDMADAFIAKYSPTGALLWAEKVGGIDFDLGQHVYTDKAGYVYLTGSYTSMMDANPGAGNYPLSADDGIGTFLIKLDPAGAFVWARNMEEGVDIALGSPGNIFVTGTFLNTMKFMQEPLPFFTSAGITDAYIGKLSHTPLPVHFLTFEVKEETAGILLIWSTAAEVNNDHFEIEKSTDGLKWSTIGFLSRKEQQAINHYSYIDNEEVSHLIYYRIKNVDIDGRSDYSQVRCIHSDFSEKDFIVSPNPGSGVFKIKPSNNKERIDFAIYNALGEGLLSGNSGEGDSFIFDLSAQADGMYYIKFNVGGKQYTKKVLLDKGMVNTAITE